MPQRPRASLFRLSLLSLALPGLAHSQNTPASAAADATSTIVVTGSRLARDPNALAPAPVSVLTSEALRAAGNTDVTATLREIPALISSSTVGDSLDRGATGAGSGGAAGAGQAVLNLRQLGANRTLVLIDGRRHVSGVEGRAAVDVSTIPAALIDRVEVLTGGASAVYGADAVTGVVNYVLKKNFQGFQFDAQTGVSSKGDGRADTVTGTFGTGFADGRGHATFSAGYTNENEVRLGARSFAANNGRANNSTIYLNPDRRFQQGDINPATMPNFANYYRVGGPGPRTSQIAFGNQIPTASEFATLFPGKTPTAAEKALIERAANAPLRVIGKEPTFAISSNSGLVFRADFDFFKADINNNGIPDCNESYVGWTGFGGGGCYTTTPTGGVRIFNDGKISTSQNQFGGDGAIDGKPNDASLTPGSRRFFAVSTGKFDLSTNSEMYWDAKFARTTTTSRNNYNTFFDTAYIATDNPWLPPALQADANEAGGLLISRDNTDFGPGISVAKRDTVRLVTGLRGELNSSLSYDFSLNFGRTDTARTFSNSVIADRFVAATDAVKLPDGRIVCRSSVDPTAIPTAPNLPVLQTGFFTFKPGDGQCQPANLFNGANSVSPQSVAFFTQPTTDRNRIKQFVATLAFSGDTGPYAKLPGGAIRYAFGGEFRQEKSQSTLSDAQLGILPNGKSISDVSTNTNLLFNDQVPAFNSGGKFNVREAFGEVRLPLLRDAPLAKELSVEGAARYAKYSTVGGATTWNLAGVWAPVSDLRMRTSYSKAIRAPDIFELFSPKQADTFRPSDPCNISDINARIAAGLPNATTRKTNCASALRALGVDPNAYEDPLTARFPGTSGGNPGLSQEKATTWTAGLVVQPSVARGLTLSVDYYSIEIRDAIAVLAPQSIVDSCYDLPSYPSQFCSLFKRRADGGFQSLSQVQLNFGRIETSGADLTASYLFNLGENRFNLRTTANWTEKLNRFFDPVDTSLVNPGLGEFSVPKWSGFATVGWARGGFSFNWRAQYVGKQAIASAIEVESIQTDFGNAGYSKPLWVHSASASYQWQKGYEVYGGVNNLNNVAPFAASSAYPASGIGRSYFIGVRAKFL
jgi:iron complex outermembrane receptor protein